MTTKVVPRTERVKFITIYFRFQIDVLVNNAGLGIRGQAVHTALSNHKNVLDVNVTGVISLTLQVLPSMIEKQKGHIVNVSSMAGKIGMYQGRL